MSSQQRRRPAGGGSASTASSSGKPKPKPKPKTAASTPFRVPGAAAKPSKLKAGRERRQRERSMDADDELDRKFSALSVAAPAFVPSFALPPTAAPPAMATSPTRSMAFVTERNPAKRVVGGSQSLAAAPARQLRASVSTDASKRPRRQRIGAAGFKTAAGPGPSPGASATPKAATTLRRHKQQADKLLLDAAEATRRPRSNSAGSDSDGEPVPEDAAVPAAAGSAFSSTLSLFSQQKHIPMRASRDVVIDTVFDALFAPSRRNKEPGSGSARFSAFGDDTGTETDEPNEEFVKRGLAATLFKDQLGSVAVTGRPGETPQQAVDRFITPAFVHAVVTELRFEDFRTASARLDILRAVHRHCPSKRLDVARALADATLLRVQYVRALTSAAHAQSVELHRAIVGHLHDQGHHFTELLRYAIEHVSETLLGFGASGGSVTPAERQELLRNYMASLVNLWRAHWLDPAGSDAEELISCAGQFVAYLPDVTAELLDRLLRAWPSAVPKQQVVAIRMCARVIMSGPPLPSLDPTLRLQRRVFARLAQAVRSPHVDVAKEALAFTGCQFAMTHFLAADPVVYQLVTQAFHANAAGHWHELIRSTSDAHFDRALDFAA